MSSVMVSQTKLRQSQGKKRSVAFVARIAPHYRVEFLNGLEKRLKAAAIDLTVFSGQPLPHMYLLDGLDQIHSGIRVPNYYLGLQKFMSSRFTQSGGNSLRPPYWQPIFHRLQSFDLVIVEQSNSALLNYPLIAWRQLLKRSPRIAFYGHGANLQRQDWRLSKFIKTTLARRADHWFVYTELSADIVRELEITDRNITTVNNSVDTGPVNAASVMGTETKQQKRRQLGLGDSPVVVFCARLSKNKALPFVVDACRVAREKFGDFTLLVIGDGVDGNWLREQAKTETWIQPLGPLYGAEKGEMLALSDVFLLPSMVGLSILDGFAAGLPVLSARFNNHSPEIAYLKDGVNGLLTDATVNAYSDAIVCVLSDEQLRRSLSAAAHQSADTYSVDAMIENFAQGIEQVLHAEGPR